MRTAFFILAGQPSPSTLQLANALARKIENVIILSDAPPTCTTGEAEIVHMPDDEARAAGYHSSSPLIPKTPIAWDKAIYLMRQRDYDYAWFCEDDVLAVSADAAAALVSRYESSDVDLLGHMFFAHADRPGWAHWVHESNFDKRELVAGFFPLCRLSRRFSLALDRHIGRYGAMTFIETMFGSLAKREGLTLQQLPELIPSAFRFNPPLRPDEIAAEAAGGAQFFHPVKSDELRSEIMTATANGALPLRGVSRLAIRIGTMPRRIVRSLRRRFKQLGERWPTRGKAAL